MSNKKKENDTSVIVPKISVIVRDSVTRTRVLHAKQDLIKGLIGGHVRQWRARLQTILQFLMATEMNEKMLRIHWRDSQVDIKIDLDKCTLLDIVLEYEEEAKKKGFKLDYNYPTFGYSFKMKNRKLVTDKDLLLMFERLAEKKKIDIWVGTIMKPNDLYKLVLNLRSQNEMKKKASKVVITEEGDRLMWDESESEDGENVTTREVGNVSLEDLEDTSLRLTYRLFYGYVFGCLLFWYISMIEGS